MPYLASETRYDTMTYNRTGRSGLKLPAISLGWWYNFGGLRSRSRTAAPSPAAPSTWQSPTSTWPTTTVRRPAPPRRPSACLSSRISIPIVMSSSSPPRPATTCGRARMANGARGNICSPAWTPPSSAWARLRGHLLQPPPRSRDAARRDHGGARHRRPPGQGSLCRHLHLQSRADTRAQPKILREMGTPCLIHQPSYNMFDRWIEDGLLDVLVEEGIGCIVFSPLAQGQLTDRYLKGIPIRARATKTERVWLTPDDVKANLPEGAKAQRSRRGTRTIPRPDGHRLDVA